MRVDMRYGASAFERRRAISRTSRCHTAHYYADYAMIFLLLARAAMLLIIAMFFTVPAPSLCCSPFIMLMLSPRGAPPFFIATPA